MTVARERGRLPRLRWAIRHPWKVLERGGFAPTTTAVLLAFVTAVVGWLGYTYFVYLS